MSNRRPTLYELFDEKNLQYWERLAKNGIRPDREQLADLIEANGADPLPAWLNPLILKGLRGELKGKRGRPAKSNYYQLCISAAAADYERVLKQMLKAEKAKRKAGTATAGKGRTHAPAHQRAAEQVVREWRLPISWRSLLNEIHSRK